MALIVLVFACLLASVAAGYALNLLSATALRRIASWLVWIRHGREIVSGYGMVPVQPDLPKPLSALPWLMSYDGSPLGRARLEEHRQLRTTSIALLVAELRVRGDFLAVDLPAPIASPRPLGFGLNLISEELFISVALKSQSLPLTSSRKGFSRLLRKREGNPLISIDSIGRMVLLGA